MTEQQRAWTQDEIDADMGIDDGDEEPEFDCYMGPDGQCGAAGSEDCEFECPYRRMQYQRESRKERAK